MPPPRVFTKIHIKYVVNGENVTPVALESVIKLSEDKYCSVGGMLKASVPILASFKIVN